MTTVNTSRPAAAAPTGGVPGPAAFLARLVADGLISQESADRARVLSNEMGIHMLPGLLRLNAIAERPLYRAWAQSLGWPLVDDAAGDPDTWRASAAQLMQELHLAASWAELRGLLVFEDGGGWWLAVREELAPQARELLGRKAAQRGVALQLAVITPTLYDTLRPRQPMSDGFAAASDDLKTLRELAEEGPTIELVNAILSQAVTQRASDVHIEPGEFDFAVRVRVDGEMLRAVDAAARSLRRGGLPGQDPGQSGHRRAPPAAGRSHQCPRQRRKLRHPGFGAARLER